MESNLTAEKNKEWMHEQALNIYRQTIGSQLERNREMKCWRYYHGYMNPSDWEYLTDIKSKDGQESFALPAKIRNISIQRSPIDLLVSQASRRPFILSTYISDKKGKEQKQKTMFMDMLDNVKKGLLNERMQYQNIIMQMQSQMQQIQQILQQEPQTPEEAQQIEQLKAVLPQLQANIDMTQSELNKKITLNEESMNKIEEYYTYDYKDIKEMIAQKGIKKLIAEHNIRTQRVLGITDRFVTGKEYRFVDYNPESNRTEYSYVNAMNVCYPRIAGIDWVEDGPWCTIKDIISYNDVVDIYGDSKDITDDMLKEIEGIVARSTDNTTDSSFYDGLYAGTDDTSNGVERVRVYWKVPKVISISKKENKNNPDIDFTHFSEGSMDAEQKKKYKSVKQKYMNDVFEATIIAGKFVVNARRKDEATIDRDNYMKRKLPLVGPTFSNVANQPYSLIWATKDLQDLYVLLHYHRELIVAVSGVKGQIIDVSQKPDDMSLEEHRAHVKTGNLYIQTVKKTGRVNSPYNQWKDYDNTLPLSIQYIDNMLEAIRNTALEIIGVPRQRLGQIVATDQVGTSEMAKEQSMLITEILFWKHDEVELRAMTQLINYYCKYIWAEGDILDVKGPEGMEYVNIPKGMLSDNDYTVIYQNSAEEEMAKSELKQMAFRQSEKGQLPFERLLDIYDMESLVQLKKSFRYWTKKSQELAEKAQQGQIDAQMEAQKELKRFDQEFQMMMQQGEQKLKEYDLQLKKAKQEFDAQVANDKLALENRKLNTDAAIKMEQINSEREVEMTYLQEQNRSAIKNEALQEVQLQLQAIQMNLNALLEDNNIRVKMKDIDVKAKQARAKEKIKD